MAGLGIAFYADPSATGVTVVDFGTKEKIPTGAPTDKFGFTVGISKAGGAQSMYRIQADRQQGSGMAEVTGSSPRYAVKVTGKTAEGVGVEATLECLK